MPYGKLKIGNIIDSETTTKQTQSAITKSFYFAKNITLKFSVYQLWDEGVVTLENS